MGSISLENRRILVTGGNGYLGRHLVAALKKEKSKVYIMDMKVSGTENEFETDITDFETVNRAISQIKPQIIFHLAASLDRNRDFSVHDKVMNVNYYGTRNLLFSLQNVEYENLIFTGTSEIYGDNIPPFHETQLPQPASAYSLSKFCAETLIQSFSKVYEKNFTILRLFNFLGKNMPETFFIPELICTLKNNETFKMTKGGQARDFLYVDDVIQALLLSAKKTEALNQVFNVCSSISTTLKDLVTQVNDKIGSNGKIEFGAIPYRKAEVWDMVGNNDKIKNALGFKVNYSINSIIDELLKQ